MKNPRLDSDLFASQRAEALASWPTGAAVDLDEAVVYQSRIPESRRFAGAMREAAANRRLLIQPRAGVALIDEHIRLLRFLETEGEADLLPTTIDAYTRQNQYAEAQKGIDRSKEAGRSVLNGFPAVNHGLL
ncbi:MAG TPA: hypothetical protein VLH81_05450, partial [Desulfobacterales bacterium]|nr:hypothetical protein [Desulfobacterales bacterium]